MFGKAVLKRGAVVVASALVALGATTMTAGSASAAPSPGVCNGGSVLAGTYSSLTIQGDCAIDAGTVNVTGNVTLKPLAELIAAFGGSDLHVKGNISASYSILVLGCGPSFPCFNDPDPNNPTLTTHHTIGGKLVGSSTFDMIVHSNSIKGDVKFTNGGNGNNCDFDPPLGSPDYSAFEDNNIGGAVTITHITACWMGFIRNNVVGTVIYNNNSTYDTDGNEVLGNKIGGDLRCQGNNPPPQQGDGAPDPNLVAGVRTGQCQSTSLP